MLKSRIMFMSLASIVVAGVLSYIGTSVIANASGVARYSVDELARVYQEDTTKPVFTGTMNGVAFRAQLVKEDLGCSSSAEVVATPVSQEIEDIFNVTGKTLLDATLTDEVAFACDGKPVLLTKTYRFDFGTVEVVRSSGNAVVSVAPADRMHTIQVGNTSATLITNLPVPDMRKDTPLEEWPAWRLIVKDGQGILEIRSRGMPVKQGIELASELIVR